MPTFNAPLQLSGVIKVKIWGQRDLAPYFEARRGRVNPNAAEELIGEVWVTDDLSRFQNGPTAGMTLAEASEKYGPELLGSSWSGRRFPILAKYIFTSDWLSVQVHPDDAYAAAHDPGSLGKCEAWYFLRSEPEAAILLGLKPTATFEQLRQAFTEGTSREFLATFRPLPGEAIYLPSGMIHALGPGLVVFEVEENSDLTYRLDDFGRLGLDGKPRPLHLEKGLAVVRPDLAPLRDLPQFEFKEKYGLRRFVLACRFFALEVLTVQHIAAFRSSAKRVEVLSVFEGEGRIENEAGWLAYRRGDTWLIPPAAGLYRVAPLAETRILKFYVPDLEKDFREPLQQRGVRAAQIQQIIFD